jgi:hypothetical protein
MRSGEARARPVYRQAVMRADSASSDALPDPTVLLEAAATVELCGAKGKPGSPRGASCAGSPDDGGVSGGDNGSASGGGSVPGLKRQLQWHHLVGVTFFAVCGGDYGIEDSVGSGGVAYSLLGLLLLPWFWSLPIALMTAELGAMIPEARRQRRTVQTPHTDPSHTHTTHDTPTTRHSRDTLSATRPASPPLPGPSPVPAHQPAGWYRPCQPSPLLPAPR